MDLPRTPSFRLDGKRALVTGGTRGIGLAAAAALAEAGAAVTVIARRAEDVAAAAAAIGGEGVALDVTDFAAVRTFVAAAEPFDILVNSAGGARHAAFLDVTEADYRAIVDLNLGASLFVAQAVAARLATAGRPGSIIHISSQMGHVGGPNRGVYCASKWAMEGWTKAMAIDLAPFGIRANTIGPTFIETPLTKPFFENAAFKDWVLSKIKLGRLGQVTDLMGAVVFLASDAAALMTGSAMLVDGGWTAE
jgi:NAD(P)-dependent dehydrogenase (short-subunit alcohol dehydrogenase family)